MDKENTVNSLLIELGYREMTAYIEVSIFLQSLYCTDIAPFITNSVISKENTGPLDFDKEGVDCRVIVVCEADNNCLQIF